MENERNNLQRFCADPPIPVQAQFSTPGWNFIMGVELSQEGERAARSTLVNFLWYHLGPTVSNENAIQKLRKEAFARFGQSLVNFFPNCFSWKGRVAKIGGKQPWSPLLNGIADVIRARKTQNYGRNQPDYKNFWAITQQSQQQQQNEQNGHNQSFEPQEQQPQQTQQLQQQQSSQQQEIQQQQPSKQQEIQQQPQSQQQSSEQQFQQQQQSQQQFHQQQLSQYQQSQHHVQSNQRYQSHMEENHQQPSYMTQPNTLMFDAHQEFGQTDQSPQFQHLQRQIHFMHQQLQVQQQHLQGQQMQQQTTTSPMSGPRFLDISNFQSTPKSGNAFYLLHKLIIIF